MHAPQVLMSLTSHDNPLKPCMSIIASPLYEPRSTFLNQSISAHGAASLVQLARPTATSYGLVRPVKASQDLGSFADENVGFLAVFVHLIPICCPYIKLYLCIQSYIIQWIFDLTLPTKSRKNKFALIS